MNTCEVFRLVPGTSQGLSKDYLLSLSNVPQVVSRTHGFEWELLGAKATVDREERGAKTNSRSCVCAKHGAKGSADLVNAILPTTLQDRDAALNRGFGSSDTFSLQFLSSDRKKVVSLTCCNNEVYIRESSWTTSPATPPNSYSACFPRLWGLRSRSLQPWQKITSSLSKSLPVLTPWLQCIWETGFLPLRRRLHSGWTPIKLETGPTGSLRVKGVFVRRNPLKPGFCCFWQGA